LRILLLAPPGAGKGTQGTRLADHFGIQHIAVGDLLRDHIRRGTELGQLAAGYVERGELVPDDAVMAAVMPTAIDAAAAGGFVLDGFPRSMPQALAAADLARRLGITLHAAVYLQVPEGELVSRLLSRAQLEERRDDMPEVIRRRLRIFSEQTAPLVDYYRDRGILLTVEGNQSPDDVTATILRGLKELAPGSEQPPP
jgi:adenylate kinase